MKSKYRMYLTEKWKDSIFCSIGSYEFFHNRFVKSHTFNCYYYIVRRGHQKVWMLNLHLTKGRESHKVHSKKAVEAAKKYGALVKYEE